jgi:hypothetical protein
MMPWDRFFSCLATTRDKGYSPFSHRNLTVQFSIHQARDIVVIAHSIIAAPFISLIRKHYPSPPEPINTYFLSSLQNQRVSHALLLQEWSSYPFVCIFSSRLVLKPIHVSFFVLYPQFFLLYFYFLSQQDFVGQIKNFLDGYSAHLLIDS